VKISCLTLIMGETGGTRRNSGLVETVITLYYPRFPERFLVENKRLAQTPDHGADWAISSSRGFPVNHSCVVKPLYNTPLFPDHPLSDSDSGRVRRFRAQSRLRWQGETCRLFDDLRRISRRRKNVASDSGSGLIIGDFRSLPHRREQFYVPWETTINPKFLNATQIVATTFRMTT
jgi:hypothetical protein